MMDVMEVAAALRRAAENAGCGTHAVMSGSGYCPDGSCGECLERSRAWFSEAADAIERSALPEGVEWPSVGGRKVDFKTAYEPGLGVLEAVCVYSNGACEVMSHDGIIKPVSEIRPVVLAADGEPLEVGQTVYGTRDLEPVEIVSLRSKEYDGVRTVKCKDRTGFVFYAPDDLIHQRPVLDADGAEIRVGDTVYYVDGHEQKVNTVARLTDGLVQFGRINEAGYVTYCEGACISPDQLTHERPVLDADGVPIKKGDTVYVAPFDDPLTVRGFAADGRVLMDYHSDDSFGYRPENITHTKPEPPDSRRAIVNEIGDEMAARIDLLVSSGRWSDAD